MYHRGEIAVVLEGGPDSGAAPEAEWVSGKEGVWDPRAGFTPFFATELMVGKDNQLLNVPFRANGSPNIWAPEKLP